MVAKPQGGATAPLALQLEVELLDRMSEPVREGKAKSVSELIRAALERFNFENVVVMHPAQLIISVRLPPHIRSLLKKTARTRHTSVAHLVRAAVEAYLPQLETQAAGQLEMPIEPAPAPKPPTKPKRKKKAKARRPAPKPKKKKARAMTRKRKG